MLAKASFFVSSFSNYFSPVEVKRVYAKSYLCFLQNKMSFLLIYVSVLKVFVWLFG
jgi:hypothetical protein